MSDFDTRTFGDVRLIRGDCLHIMPTLVSGAATLVFADLPYQKTACKWDYLIDTPEFWTKIVSHLKRDAICAFTTDLALASKIISSAPIPYKYDLVLHKSRSTGFLRAKLAPLRAHEHVLIFENGKASYNVQMVKTWRPQRLGKEKRHHTSSDAYGLKKNHESIIHRTDMRYPTSVLEPQFPDSDRGLHPTQKPVALLEWLIRTYTNDGDTIFDPVSGSGTTAIAAMNVSNRKVVCIEKDPAYFEVMCKRIAEHQQKLEAVREEV